MKKQCIKVIPRGLLAGAVTAAISLLPGIAAAEPQVAVLSNKNLIVEYGNNTAYIEAGEDFGLITALSGDGLYDVYAAYAKFGDGGELGDIDFLDENSTPVLWDSNVALPARLRGNLDMANSPVKERMVSLFPKKQPSEHGFDAGTYVFAVGLSTPGQYDFPVLEFIVVNVE